MLATPGQSSEREQSYGSFRAFQLIFGLTGYSRSDDRGRPTFLLGQLEPPLLLEQLEPRYLDTFVDRTRKIGAK